MAYGVLRPCPLRDFQCWSVAKYGFGGTQDLFGVGWLHLFPRVDEEPQNAAANEH
jgi:hypothetical protein